MNKGKIYIFAGNHAIAEGEGKIQPDGKFVSATRPEEWGKPDADPMKTVIDALDDMKVRQKMEVPEITCQMMLSKAGWRRLRRQVMGKKQRLPRKMKKAITHTGRRTKWLQRLVCLFLRKLARINHQNRQHERFKQYLAQHQGMLTYRAPIVPAPTSMDRYAGSALVLDPKQQFMLGTMLNHNTED